MDSQITQPKKRQKVHFADQLLHPQQICWPDATPSVVQAPTSVLKPQIPLSGTWCNDETQYVQLNDLAGEGWNCWPQGNFAMDLTWEEFSETDGLMVHWATKTTDGKQKSGASRDASHPSFGYRRTRQCWGHIECTNKDCAIVMRPHTTSKAAVNTQCAKPCKCGSELVWKPCENRSAVIIWAKGVRYFNGIMDHNHGWLPYKLHLRSGEKQELKELFQQNPTAKPAALGSGNTVSGKSASDVSSVLLNSDRLAAEKRKMKGTSEESGDDFVQWFSEFQIQNPNFIVSETMIGGVAVISCQTPFMASLLHDKITEVDGPFNGVVSDAAHRWWKVKTSLLIVSSVFVPIIEGWVPALMSYSNGASGRHYELHFLALMESIAKVAVSKGQDIVDELFAQVSLSFTTIILAECN